jgi:hypothetical protein
MTEAKAPSPSEMVTATLDTADAIDKRGRRIVVQRLNALQVFRITKALGAATAANPAAADMATLACTVRKIDTLDLTLPANERDVEFALQTLDFDGLAAAAEALGKLGAKVDEEALVESVKN